MQLSCSAINFAFVVIFFVTTSFNQLKSEKSKSKYVKINLHTTHELSNTRQELTSTFSKLCTRSPLEKENREKRRRILMEDKIMRSLPKTQKIIGFLSIPAKF